MSCLGLLCSCLSICEALDLQFDLCSRTRGISPLILKLLLVDLQELHLLSQLRDLGIRLRQILLALDELLTILIRAIDSGFPRVFKLVKRGIDLLLLAMIDSVLQA